LTERATGGTSCVVKAFVLSLSVLMLIGLVGASAQAHPEILGVPDPSWQQPANGLPDGATAAPPAIPRSLEVFVYAAGGLSVLLLLSLVRSLFGSRRKSGARRVAAPRYAADTLGDTLSTGPAPTPLHVTAASSRER